MTSETKLGYDFKKENTFGYEYIAGCKGYIWTLAMRTVFQLIINLGTIMRIHRAITQIIHTNITSWVCSVTQAIEAVI